MQDRRGKQTAHKVVEWFWTHVSSAMLVVSVMALIGAAVILHLDHRVNSNQHKINTIVYGACASDTVAEKNANLVVEQLRGIIDRQIVLLRIEGRGDLIQKDEALLKKLPTFPPLPPCGDKP